MHRAIPAEVACASPEAALHRLRAAGVTVMTLECKSARHLTLDRRRTLSLDAEGGQTAASGHRQNALRRFEELTTSNVGFNERGAAVFVPIARAMEWLRSSMPNPNCWRGQRDAFW
jgi:hypothetical protein